jgi:hypothetical protein
MLHEAGESWDVLGVVAESGESYSTRHAAEPRQTPAESSVA